LEGWNSGILARPGATYLTFTVNQQHSCKRVFETRLRAIGLGQGRLGIKKRIISKMPPKRTYTCNDYREEMRLLGLKKRLNEKNLSKTEKQTIEAEITKLEETLQMD
jgi:hypothetical protein